MYQAYQAHTDLMWPLRTAARLSLPMLTDPAYGAAARATRRSTWRHAPSASTGWRLATWEGLRLDRAVDGRATTDPACDAC